ncbi:MULTISPECIES: class I SAM-dependent methyltransferase [unclassified Mycolicibacterium]|uniref:class I SAM-dependent DNA methyltransferase n=1 Tax=unclassified Mycolicibacterium TaxID=2636767 RepID=UPI0013099C87|nr:MULTISPECIES: class I SAM-dependent methyltransferase [unclassified Mycolicibacterium]MUL83090.1 class I SAM-dependent methyltransferase [Mycolicibacterium sp. CBMA 329]MUL89425.1 class I SAM-dependent methyltransferase [Mycolicibacterium sp. CBMA 331]MUL99114.1 class I SAM-dependent methyltransferase [Mycolicibacterium sp. CBMA 334]MUM24740.1 class I SAM-dependent methyltransferase [Mycolicibacterium sp. CBMA 295]MUM38941.1 class I SAM-dependent methyltransferase [Mycolicibacterium sp. CBM
MCGQVYDQYELIAEQYAQTFTSDFEARPFDRAVVRSFSELVLQSGGSTALDVGCGPGEATAELTECGLRAEGIDGSAAMVSIARQRWPGVPFQTADMFDLPHEAGTFDAVCAWYSIIHTPTEVLPELFTRFRRVLTDPGWLLLGFQTDAAPAVYDHAFGREVALTFLRHDADTVCTALEASGFTVYATAKRARQAQLDEPTAQAMVIAHTT